MTLILKHANKNRLGAVEWGPNDFDVIEGDRCIGRIFLSAQAPQGRPWFWTITAIDYPPTNTVAAIAQHASKRWWILKRVRLDFPRVAFPSKFLQNYFRERRHRHAVYRSFRAGAIRKRYANNFSSNSVTSDNCTAISAVTTDRDFVCHFGPTCY